HEVGGFFFAQTTHITVMEITYQVWSGVVALLRGDPREAKAIGDALTRAADFGLHRCKPDALRIAGIAACMEEDYPEGKRLCEEVDRVPYGMVWVCWPITMWGLALAECGLGAYEAALRYVEALQQTGVTRHSRAALLLSLPPQAVILAHAG